MGGLFLPPDLQFLDFPFYGREFQLRYPEFSPVDRVSPFEGFSQLVRNAAFACGQRNNLLETRVDLGSPFFFERLGIDTLELLDGRSSQIGLPLRKF